MKLPAFLLLLSLAPLQTIAQERPVAVLSAPGGRYVFGQISSMRADQYMLDTQTGRLWQITQDTNSAITLQPIHYVFLDRSVGLAPKTAEQEQEESYARYLQDRVGAAAGLLLWLEKNPQGGTYERGSYRRTYTEAEVKAALPDAKEQYENAARMKATLTKPKP